MPSTDPLHIVVAGGGVAAVETVLALHELAGERVKITLVAPQPDFEVRALRTAEPFAADHVRRRSLADLARDTGAELVASTVTSVDPERRAVRLATGRALHYDALVLALGARPRPAFARALTFAGDEPATAFGGLLADLEEGWTRSVAFVVPPGATWPLPLYELALQTANDVRGMGADVSLRIVTPESAPLAIFGAEASAAVQTLLDEAGVGFIGDTYVSADERGRLLDAPLGLPLGDERTVALPVMEGPALPGVPSDGAGFFAVDEHGAVRGVTDVYAAGDGTTFPIKQGGLACQQADAIAAVLAQRAGAEVDATPFKPVLRGRLMTGFKASHQLDGHPRPVLWSAERKVDGKYLSAWLGDNGEKRDACTLAIPLG
ncbi:FAD-dependent oxidoreductase [Baekduia sp. Peel2402]|uniref:FAD-dependent oxidoreductase n=1 Tax=Baekduia sp. Peel2402 TaxID=3458296 RepID=UPI00403E4447